MQLYCVVFEILTHHASQVTKISLMLETVDPIWSALEEGCCFSVGKFTEDLVGKADQVVLFFLIRSGIVFSKLPKTVTTII